LVYRSVLLLESVLLFTIACEHNGVATPVSTRIQINCSTSCICRDTGDFNCTFQECTYDGPNGGGGGDPHYRSFDQFPFDFQGTCEYILTKLCDNDNFAVIAKNSPCVSFPGASCLQYLKIIIPRENLEFMLEGSTVMLNGVQRNSNNNGAFYQSSTVDVLRVGGRTHVFLKAFGLRINYGGFFSVQIRTSTLNLGRLCGLLGTYNGDRTDDFQKPDGTMAVSPTEFGNSWLVPNPDIPGCEGMGVTAKRNVRDADGCSTDPAVVQRAETRCGFMQQNPFTPCNNVVNASAYISDCEFDYTCTDEAMREEFVCDAFAAYARECADFGFTFFNWRLLSNCCKFASTVTIAIGNASLYERLCWRYEIQEIQDSM